MDVPRIMSSRDLDKDCVRVSSDGKTWERTRGVPYWGICLRQRIKAAWLVFTGKADALKWDA